MFAPKRISTHRQISKIRSQYHNTNIKKGRSNMGDLRMVKAGLPLVLFMLGGSYFLSIFVETHVEARDKNNQSKSTRKFNLEEEHKALMKKLDIDNFTLSRIPRPEEAANGEKPNDPKKK